MDKISQLPDPVLHEILRHLSSKEAFRTCVLSKAWRHVASTRPHVVLREISFFKTKGENFLTFLENTVNRYKDQNIPIPLFLLDISGHMSSTAYARFVKLIPNVVTNSRFVKLIPNVVTNSNVKTLNLKFDLGFFFLPPILLEAQHLEELYLDTCRLTQIGPTAKIQLSRLRTLSLRGVYVHAETLERIISNCPSLERVDLTECHVSEGDIIKVNKVPNLKHFVFEHDKAGTIIIGEDDDDAAAAVVINVEIEAPSIESISITGYADWLHTANHHLSSFARLKSLRLSFVQLSQDSFRVFSVDLRRLEELTLTFCRGFRELKLASRSIRNLSLSVRKSLMKAEFNLPNIRCFEFSCYVMPRSISFTTTTCSEWKSKISVLSPFEIWSIWNCHHDASTLLRKVYEFHKEGLRGSEFSLHVQDPWDWYLGDSSRPLDHDHDAVVIENLSVGVREYYCSTTEAFLCYLFCFFHPRNVKQTWHENPENNATVESNVRCLAECLHRILVGDGNIIIQDLEDVCISGSGLSHKNRYRLKWRDAS